MPATMLMNEVPAKRLDKTLTIDKITIKAKQQLLAKEVFSPIITKFDKERIIPLYTDETWSADLIDKSSLIKHNKFLLTVLDIFTKFFFWVKV